MSVTYGACECGGTFTLDTSTTDDPFVKFPCSNPACDWEQVLARDVFYDRLERQAPEVPA